MKIHFEDDLILVKQRFYIWELHRNWTWGGFKCHWCGQKFLSPCFMWSQYSRRKFYALLAALQEGKAVMDASRTTCCEKCFAKKFGLSEEERAVLKTYMILS